MKLLTEGSAWLKSKSDPRWNKNIENVLVGGFTIPQELQDELDKLKQKYGNPPEDLKWSYHKY